VDVPELLGDAEAWLRAYAPEGALARFDRQAARRALDRLQAVLRDEYVLDLAEWKEAAAGLLPYLRQSPAARPYESWLESRLDYFETAEALRVIVRKRDTAPPAPQTPSRPPAPTFEETKQVWDRTLSNRPPPARAAPRVPALKKIFAAQGVPAELVWLAEVESSFDPTARSPVGAAGLFQFMPATAERFGLSLAPEDERLHPEKSARAAARYLRILHDRFESWPLALAAYNAGEGRVGRALDRSGARDFAGVAQHLPAETQLYVPKVLATVEEREGVRLEAL
jgi:membrane-bound lytic murein transglycosylase D